MLINFSSSASASASKGHMAFGGRYEYVSQRYINNTQYNHCDCLKCILVRVIRAMPSDMCATALSVMRGIGRRRKRAPLHKQTFQSEAAETCSANALSRIRRCAALDWKTTPFTISVTAYLECTVKWSGNRFHRHNARIDNIMQQHTMTCVNT